MFDLEYCQDCGEWVKTCEHQRPVGEGLIVTFVITDEQPIDMIDDEQPGPEQKRHWWEVWK